MRPDNVRPVFFVLTLALAGCASPPYQDPGVADAATLTIQNDSDSLAGLRGYKGASDCSGQVMFDKTGGVAAKSSLKIKVKPDEPFTLSIDAKIKGFRYSSSAYNGRGGLVSEMNCPIFATFTPQKNTSYVAAYHATPAAPDDASALPSCKLTLYRVENDALVEDPSLRERALGPKPFTGEGAFCK